MSVFWEVGKVALQQANADPPVKKRQTLAVFNPDARRGGWSRPRPRHLACSASGWVGCWADVDGAAEQKISSAHRGSNPEQSIP